MALHPMLELEPTGDGRFRVRNEGKGDAVVFGGQLLGQTILAAAATQPTKQVRTLQTVFARAARASAETELVVAPIHEGRSFGSLRVSAMQGDRLCAQSLVLLHVPDPDLMQHEAAMPDVEGPDSAAPAGASPLVFPGAELRIVGGVDVNDPDETGPAELHCWLRHGAAPDAQAARQAMLAFATDGFLIGTAMRPHPGIGQRDAHRTLSTGVVGHTLSFLGEFDPSDWLLLSHESTQAGAGRAHGRALVFSRDGRLVASFSQDAMIRAMPAGSEL